MAIRKLVVLNCIAISMLVGCGKGRTTEELLIESAQRIVANQTNDPFAVQFRSMVGSEKAGMVCGEVNSKNAMGGYVGFKQFMLTGDVDTTTHTFKTWKDLLIAPTRPPLPPSITSASKEEWQRFEAGIQAHHDYLDAVKPLSDCFHTVRKMKEEAEERQANKATLDKVLDFLKGTSS